MNHLYEEIEQALSYGKHPMDNPVALIDDDAVKVDGWIDKHSIKRAYNCIIKHEVSAHKSHEITTIEEGLAKMISKEPSESLTNCVNELAQYGFVSYCMFLNFLRQAEKAFSTKKLDKKGIADKFFWHVRSNFKSQTEAAKHYGVSNHFISVVCRGVRMPNKKMLNDIGYKKETVFVPVKDGE